MYILVAFLVLFLLSVLAYVLLPVETTAFIVASFVPILVSVALSRKQYTFRKKLSYLLGGLCISAFFLFYPRYRELSLAVDPEASLIHPFPGFRSIVYTLYDSLKAMGGGQDLEELEGLTLGKNWQWIYLGLNYLFYIAAPILTSGLILSLFGDLADRARCRLGSGKKHHVFSELNRTSLSLAGKLREKYPKDRIVFCNTKNADNDLVVQARGIGALLLYRPCEGVRSLTRKKTLVFYAVSGNEDENLNCTEALIRKYKDKKDASVTVNAFAESSTGIEVVEKLSEKSSVHVSFIDETELLCNQLLLQHPLDQLPEGQDTISLVIIGCDKTGMHMLKAAAWCGQVLDRHLKIRVYDRNAPLLREILRAQCPELIPNCDIGFVAVDARTAALEESLLDEFQGSPDATYVVMAMGDDELNIGVAERLYRLYRHHNRYRWTPKILVRIRNSTKSDVYSGPETNYLKDRNIHIFSNMEEVFAKSSLFHSYLDRLSFAVHLNYSPQWPKQDIADMSSEELRAYFASKDVRNYGKKFLRSEYSRRSSMAAALHIPVKLRSCGVLSAEEGIPTEDTVRRFREKLEREPDLLERLAINEHLRWNQFTRTEGYVRADWEDLMGFYPLKPNNKDELGKRHLCLTDWEKLDDLNRKYMALNPPEPKNFMEGDLNLIRRIPDIVLLAKRMEEIELEL